MILLPLVTIVRLHPHILHLSMQLSPSVKVQEVFLLILACAEK